MFAVAAKPAQSVDLVSPLIHGLLQLWPLWLVVVGVGALKLAGEIYSSRRLRRAGILDIDRMGGHEFELRLAALFRDLGYRSEIVGSARGDFGGDLVVSKGGKRSVVQAKCWSKNIGVRAVQEVVAARGYYETDGAYVVTNRRFTQQARELAKRNGVQLWGRDELVEALLRTQKKPQSAPVLPPAPTMTPAATGPSAPTDAFCARCGESVSTKVREYCLTHSERFAGLIYCYPHQRSVRS